jgi:hypothetical protein
MGQLGPGGFRAMTVPVRVYAIAGAGRPAGREGYPRVVNKIGTLL